MNKIEEARRPLRCRWGLHKYGNSMLDRKVGNLEFWDTRCTRCGARLCYSVGPFIVNGKQVRR